MTELLQRERALSLRKETDAWPSRERCLQLTWRIYRLTDKVILRLAWVRDRLTEEREEEQSLKLTGLLSLHYPASMQRSVA